MEQLDQFSIVLTAIFDILNCEKCSNISYFALTDEINQITLSLFNLKIIGCEQVLAKVFDMLDSLLIMCSASKVNLKYGNPHQMIIHSTAAPYLSNFIDSAK